jgi:hypothetical protein
MYHLSMVNPFLVVHLLNLMYAHDTENLIESDLVCFSSFFLGTHPIGIGATSLHIMQSWVLNTRAEQPYQILIHPVSAS